MNASARSRLTRLLLGFSGALVALSVIVTPTMAATELSQYGKVGVTSPNEDDGEIVCNYDFSNDDLQSITVAAPAIYARNTTSGVDSGQVGWQIIVRRKLDSQVKFHTVLKSTIAKTTTTDDAPAAFKSRTVVPFVPDDSTFIVIVKSFWFRADGSVVGWVKTRIDRYAEDDTVHHFFPINGCSDRYLF
jgi:hypothetical protein